MPGRSRRASWLARRRASAAPPFLVSTHLSSWETAEEKSSRRRGTSFAPPTPFFAVWFSLALRSGTSRQRARRASAAHLRASTRALCMSSACFRRSFCCVSSEDDDDADEKRGSGGLVATKAATASTSTLARTASAASRSDAAFPESTGADAFRSLASLRQSAEAPAQARDRATRRTSRARSGMARSSWAAMAAKVASSIFIAVASSFRYLSCRSKVTAARSFRAVLFATAVALSSSSTTVRSSGFSSALEEGWSSFVKVTAGGLSDSSSGFSFNGASSVVVVTDEATPPLERAGSCLFVTAIARPPLSPFFLLGLVGA
mmetsp:Transcript_8049/g.26453  ORF Transcript_8049/g.26453 Transcript_8049/m.26453 type:complete len:319 (-) Transcript_8049:3706-4662(-)